MHFFQYQRQPCPPRTFAYVIQAGDTVYSLAQRYTTSVAAIISANPFLDLNFLQVGQRICIPMQLIYPACPEGNYYAILSGDTLYSIAQFFNVSLDDLLEANPAINPYQLLVGQIVCIPLATPPIACLAGTEYYTIQPGDTFYTIAQRFNTTVEDLIRLNPTINPQALLIGQQVCIPENHIV